MSRIIKVNKILDCGCCGEYFRTWEGYEDQDQDDGYGVCAQCQEEIEFRIERDEDNLIAVVQSELSPGSLVKYNAKTREEQIAFGRSCIERGLIAYRISPA